MLVNIFAVLVLAGQSVPAKQTTGYPQIVAGKKLFADRDLRGHPMPDLSDPNVDALEWVQPRPLPLADAKKRVVIYEFWASWSSPCEKFRDILNIWTDRFRGKVEVVTITSDTLSTAKKFVARHRISGAVAADSGGKHARALGLRTLPYVFVVSPDGIVRWQGVPDDRNDPLTDQKIDQIVVAGTGV